MPHRCESEPLAAGGDSRWAGRPHPREACASNSLTSGFLRNLIHRLTILLSPCPAKISLNISMLGHRCLSHARMALPVIGYPDHPSHFVTARAAPNAESLTTPIVKKTGLSVSTPPNGDRRPCHHVLDPRHNPFRKVLHESLPRTRLWRYVGRSKCCILNARRRGRDDPSPPPAACPSPA